MGKARNAFHHHASIIGVRRRPVFADPVAQDLNPVFDQRFPAGGEKRQQRLITTVGGPGEDRLQQRVIPGGAQHELRSVGHTGGQVTRVFGESGLHSVEECRGFAHDEGVAEFVLGAEFGVQALAADADRRRNRPHPDRRPTPRQHHVTRGVEGELTQSGPAEGTGFRLEVDDRHAGESNRADIPKSSVAIT